MLMAAWALARQGHSVARGDPSHARISRVPELYAHSVHKKEGAVCLDCGPHRHLRMPSSSDAVPALGRR